jgi:hypothetical protein
VATRRYPRGRARDGAGSHRGAAGRQPPHRRASAHRARRGHGLP